MGKFRIVLYALVIVAGLIPGPVDSFDSLTERQIDLLAKEILRNSPQHIHFAAGKKFSWVLLEQRKDDLFPRLTIAVFELLKEKYTVFKSKSEIPREKVIVDPKTLKLQGYIDGFLFTFKVTRASGDTLKVEYSDFEGSEGASNHWKRYRWTGEQWTMIEKSAVEIS